MYADAETGLYYWNARYYDPRIGRAISSDPMSVAEHVQRWRASLGTLNQLPLELNSYAYVANNPLRWTDPSGLGTIPCPPGTSSDPNCTIYDPNTPDTIIDQAKKQNGGMSCATAECAAGVLPNPPPTTVSPCELKCSLVLGAVCKPVAAKTPGPWQGKVGAYILCEGGAEYIYRKSCEKAEQCAANKK